MNDLTEQLADKLEAALTDECLAKLRKKMSDAAVDVTQELEYNLKDSLAWNLSHYVEQMSEAAVSALLLGDEESMRRYLNCPANGYSGRDHEHHVIRGKLFETGGIDVRHKIADLYADLIRNERILDLEDQVKSLTKQIATLDARLEQSYRNHYDSN